MKNILHFGKTLLLACILFSSDFCLAQVTEQWVKRQNGDANAPDVAKDVAVDHNGNVYVTGWSEGKGTSTDFATIKYDEGSNTKWVKRYNGPGNAADQATAIAMDNNGNVYVTGWSTGNGTGSDFTTIKYDDDGDIKWVKRFNGNGNGTDQAVAIAVDEKGNVYVTGWSTGNGSSADYTTIKYNDDGDTKWVRRYNGPGNAGDQATAIAVDAYGNVYVTGWSTGNLTGTDYATIKYDKDGDQQWVQRYNGPINETDRANALALDALGNVYVTGFIATIVEEDGNPTDIATIKYNTSGLQQWVSVYNRTPTDIARAIAIDGSGNVFIAGVGGVPDETNSRDFVTIKFNASGVQQWDEIVTPTGRGTEAEVSDLILDAAGNVYVTGAVATGTFYDYVTVKYNTAGVQQWKAMYAGPGNESDLATAIDLDKNGNVYITGGSTITNSDYATIKYKPDGVQKWVKRYNGPGISNKGGIDEATAIAMDKDGNAHVTGGITRNNTGLDYTTFKYDDNGDRIWKKTYNGLGIGPDQASAIALDAEGNVYVTGRSAGNGTNDDYATIKYDKDGDTKWVKRYNGPGDSTDRASAIAVDDNGNVYVTGTSTGNDEFGDYATIKYDKDGNTKWVKRYDGPGNSADGAAAIAVDNAGNVYITGRSAGSTTFDDYATIKYDANGNELWVARYNGTGGYDKANALALDAFGNVYVTGGSQNTNFFEDYATIKYNAAGVQQWAVRYNGPANRFDIAVAITVHNDGSVYVTGESEDFGTSSDFVTIKYNATGMQQWLARYNGPGNLFDFATSLALDAAGNVYVTGGSWGSGTFDDYATIKYNAAGVQQWLARYDGPLHSSDTPLDIALDDNGNVYVTGRSHGTNAFDYDYATIKYVQTPLITSRQKTIPDATAERVKLHAWAFPNSFTQFINLQWSGNTNPVSITITDIMGKQVERRTNLAGSGTLKTGAHFSAGIYYALIVQDGDKVVLRLMKTN